MNNVSKACTSKCKLDKMVKISILAAMSFLIMMIDFPLPIFPEFLKIDLSDIPAVVGGFAMGPIAGVLIELVKNVLHLLVTKTAGIGELANFVVGACFVYTSAAIYKKYNSKKGALIGLISGTVVMGVVGALFNYFVLLPLYESVLGFPISASVEAARAITSIVVDVKTLVIFTILPFNLLKGAVVSLIVYFMYGKVAPILKCKCEK